MIPRASCCAPSLPTSKTGTLKAKQGRQRPPSPTVSSWRGWDKDPVWAPGQCPARAESPRGSPNKGTTEGRADVGDVWTGSSRRGQEKTRGDKKQHSRPGPSPLGRAACTPRLVSGTWLDRRPCAVTTPLFVLAACFPSERLGPWHLQGPGKTPGPGSLVGFSGQTHHSCVARGSGEREVCATSTQGREGTSGDCSDSARASSPGDPAMYPYEGCRTWLRVQLHAEPLEPQLVFIQ